MHVRIAIRLLGLMAVPDAQGNIANNIAKEKWKNGE
jgi:hypothetical protein